MIRPLISALALLVGARGDAAGSDPAWQEGRLPQTVYEGKPQSGGKVKTFRVAIRHLRGICSQLGSSKHETHARRNEDNANTCVALPPG